MMRNFRAGERAVVAMCIGLREGYAIGQLVPISAADTLSGLSNSRTSSHKSYERTTILPHDGNRGLMWHNYP
jgi:hypothetical protein